jgi:hypothetical protein
MASGADQAINLELHQPLERVGRDGTQKVAISAGLDLVEQKCHRILGHHASPGFWSRVATRPYLKSVMTTSALLRPQGGGLRRPRVPLCELHLGPPQPFRGQFPPLRWTLPIISATPPR